MDDQQREQLTAIYGLLNLHEALIAVLYADHIEHDTQLRDVTQTPAESLLAFRNYTNQYLKSLSFDIADPNGEQVRQAARDRVKGFFQEVEGILLSRRVLDEKDSRL